MAVRSLTTSQNNSVHAAVVVAIALVVALFAFSDALFELVKRWVGQEEYSHGFLIPVVSAWLDGALIRLTTTIFPDETEHDADERLQSFMHDIVPSLTTFLPLEGQPKSAINSNINGHG